MKKTIWRLLALALLLAAVVLAGGERAEADTWEGWSYKVDGDTAIITDYSGAGGDVVIPASLGGKPVTAIDENALHDCGQLTSA